MDNWVLYFCQWKTTTTKTVYVIYKTRGKFFSTWEMPRHKWGKIKIRYPHRSRARPYTLDLCKGPYPLRSRKYLYTPQPWSGAGFLWDGWQTHLGLWGGNFQWDQQQFPFSLSRSCEHWRAMIPTTPCCCLPAFQGKTCPQRCMNTLRRWRGQKRSRWRWNIWRVWRRRTVRTQQFWSPRLQPLPWLLWIISAGRRTSYWAPYGFHF